MQEWGLSGILHNCSGKLDGKYAKRNHTNNSLDGMNRLAKLGSKYRNNEHVFISTDGLDVL